MQLHPRDDELDEDGFEIPGVLWRRDPQATEVPLVFNSPHSGSHYPEDFRFCCPFERSAHRRGCLCRRTLRVPRPQFGATLIGAIFPRSYLDPNRAADDLDTALIDGTWPWPLSPSHRTRAGLGVGAPGGQHRHPDLRPQARRSTRSSPGSIAATPPTIACSMRLASAPTASSGSSGTSTAIRCRPSAAEEQEGRALRGFCARRSRRNDLRAGIHRFVAAGLRGRGYTVRINEVYKGVEIVKRQGRPAVHRHSLQIEVDRALYMDQKTLGKLRLSLQADITFDAGRGADSHAEIDRGGYKRFREQRPPRQSGRSRAIRRLNGRSEERRPWQTFRRSCNRISTPPSRRMCAWSGACCPTGLRRSARAAARWCSTTRISGCGSAAKARPTRTSQTDTAHGVFPQAAAARRGVLPKGGIARFYGRARIYRSGPIYEEVWRRLVQPEKDRDPQKGVSRS